MATAKTSRRKASQKTDADVGAERVLMNMQSRFNPLRTLTPDILSRQIEDFDIGHIRGLALTMRAISMRDDVLKSVKPKRIKSTSRNRYDILAVDDSPQAKKHKKALEDFYNNLRCTNAVDRNQRGGFSLLIRQMMEAIGDLYAVHEIVWMPTARSLTAEFRFAPLWFFENTTGKLRYLEAEGSITGRDIEDGGWMTTVGDGLMIACAIAYMFKQLPLKDWLIYCERNAMPGIHGKTSATPNSTQWKNMVAAVAAMAADFSCVTSKDEEIGKIDLNVSGTLPYPPLVERMDRAMATMWRGGDLSTISAGQGQGQGASLQGDETASLEDDDCQLISETLNEQVDRWVIRYALGDETPLAYIKLQPKVKKNIPIELSIDKFLVGAGARLGVADALQRYGRTAAKDDEECLVAPKSPFDSAEVTPLPNEAPVQDPDEAGALLAAARIQLPEAQHKVLEALAKPFLAIYEDAKAGNLTPEQIAAALITLRDKGLPKICLEMNAAPETESVLEETMAAAIGNGLEAGAKLLEAAK